MATELEERLYDELTQALAWLDALAVRFGDLDIEDVCPRGWAGRAAIHARLMDAETQHPEIANFPPGTLVTDGCKRGYVERRLMTKIGKRAVPIYVVSTGSGNVHTFMIADQTRRT